MFWFFEFLTVWFVFQGCFLSPFLMAATYTSGILAATFVIGASKDWWISAVLDGLWTTAVK